MYSSEWLDEAWPLHRRADRQIVVMLTNFVHNTFEYEIFFSLPPFNSVVISYQKSHFPLNISAIKLVEWVLINQTPARCLLFEANFMKRENNRVDYPLLNYSGG